MIVAQVKRVLSLSVIILSLTGSHEIMLLAASLLISTPTQRSCLVGIL